MHVYIYKPPYDQILNPIKDDLPSMNAAVRSGSDEYEDDETVSDNISN